MLNEILQELQEPNALGLLLAAQLGTTPADITLVLRTTTLNQQTGELTPIGMYQIKLGSTVEHKVTLGPFNHAAAMDDHPILYHHNHIGIRVFVTNPAPDVDAAYDNLAAAYLEMFGQYRQLIQDLNQRAEPDEILEKGMGVLGEFPEPFALTAARVLHENGVKTTLVAGDAKIGGFKLLAFDNSYFVARTLDVQKVE
jgi:hypothetical protein